MNLAIKLKKSLPHNIYKMLINIGHLADINDYSLYVVGGFVRDLILGVRNLDIDLVVKKNGIEFAKTLSKQLKATLVKYPKFGTATLIFPNKFKLDIATSRSETYVLPGALPQVQFGSIKDDLYRRDFTINALAIALNEENFGELIDFFNGLDDLKAKYIRVLHNLSFVDDPTRIFRAVRFEQRYGFKIDVATQCLIKEAVSLHMFDKISGERLRNEIILLLREKEPFELVLRMKQLNQLRFIHPKLKLNSRIKNAFKRLPQNYALTKAFFPHKEVELWLLYFSLLINGLGLKELEKLCRKFVLTRNQTQIILAYKRKANSALKILSKSRLKPFQIYEVLSSFSPEVLILILSNKESIKVKQKILLFLKKINKIKLGITGGDLKKLNIPPGPLFKDILKQVLFLKIDGTVRDKRQEQYWAKKLAGKWSG